jgi:mannose-6-phosphate isomerase-like protein (cupin superfamily)
VSLPEYPAPGYRGVSESFFVLSGTVRLYDGRQWTDARAGDYLFVPEGGPLRGWLSGR